MHEFDEIDNLTFDDSERFEEDSCSYFSEPESINNNWRGWKRPPQLHLHFAPASKSLKQDGKILSLTALACRKVATNISFEVVEQCMPVIPEQIQRCIAFWSFPDSEEDIRLYSCLANGNAEEFTNGERLYKRESVQDVLQIGFHLSAVVVVPCGGSQPQGQYEVAITFDRGRIITCNCTCGSTASWCGHVVAVCLHRIYQPQDLRLRAPVSESLTRLQRDQLQKFAQYLISELPSRYLRTAQRFIDEILGKLPTEINTVCGAPDPTAGASAGEKSAWWLDEGNLHDSIHKKLVKFCMPTPLVYSDVNFLSSTAPPVAAEWQSLLRPLRGREPEGMWNLLSIVREMFKRLDHNAVPLLNIITTECIKIEKVLVWWFNTRVSLLTGSAGQGGKHNVSGNSNGCQYACSSLCDEVVYLWRLAALNPALSPQERVKLMHRLKDWHLKVLDKVDKSKETTGNNTVQGGNNNNGNNNHQNRRSDADVFPGFRPAIEACLLSWDDYPLPGITYSPSRYYSSVLGCDSGRPVGALPVYHGATEAVVDGQPVAEASALAGLSHELIPLLYGNSFESSTSNAKTSDKLLNYKAKNATVSGSVRVRVSSGSDHHFHHLAGSSCVLPLGASAANSSFSLLPEESERTGGRLQAAMSNSSVSSEGFCDNDTARDSPNSCKDRAVFNSYARRASDGAGAVNREEGETPKRGDEVRPFYPNNNASSAASVAAASLAELNNADVSVAQWVTSHQPRVQFGARQRHYCSSQRSWDNGRSANKPANSDNFEGASAFPDYRTRALCGGQSGAEQQHGGAAVGGDGVNGCSSAQEKPAAAPDVFSNIRKLEDPLEILFARAEGLHAHGHLNEASKLAVQLAEHLLANPPNLLLDLPHSTSKNKRKKVHPASHQMTCLASETLSKCSFLCTVLADHPSHTHLAFNLALFGLEMPRHPASTKPLEVKLAYQEMELVSHLKRMRVSCPEFDVIRDKAEQLRSGTQRSRGQALLPLMLAAFVFDALVMRTVFESSSDEQLATQNLEADQILGFEAAVAALSMKANVSEAEHPLLCEGTRKQKGELALTLLTHYKDDQTRLAMIMDKFLDKEVHQMFKSPSTASFYSPANCSVSSAPDLAKGFIPDHACDRPFRSMTNAAVTLTSHLTTTSILPQAFAQTQGPVVTYPQVSVSSAPTVEYSLQGHSLSNRPNNVGGSTSPAVSTGGARAKDMHQRHHSGYSSSSGGGRVNEDEVAVYHSPGDVASWQEQYKAWQENESKLRSQLRGEACTKRGGAGSDSGSSGNSSDSLASFSRADKPPHTEHKPVDSPLLNPVPMQTGCQPITESGFPRTQPAGNFGKGFRCKGKRAYPTVPNQPSEANAYFMFEMAKTVLNKAGGNSSTSLFEQHSGNQNNCEPHRALQMCAFQIGLYALGLHNCVSPNWLSRTYSSHVSWISNQAIEIGASALEFLMETWEGHLTPQEAVGIADKASRGGDAHTVRQAARLALSCLHHAHALNPNEIQRALIQCKEQSSAMLESACVAIENAAKGGGTGGVYPEVLFEVSRCWYNLYETRCQHLMGTSARGVLGRTTGGSRNEHEHSVIGLPGSRGALPQLPSSAPAPASTGQRILHPPQGASILAGVQGGGDVAPNLAPAQQPPVAAPPAASHGGGFPQHPSTTQPLVLPFTGLPPGTPATTLPATFFRLNYLPPVQQPSQQLLPGPITQFPMYLPAGGGPANAPNVPHNMHFCSASASTSAPGSLTPLLQPAPQHTQPSAFYVAGPVANMMPPPVANMVPPPVANMVPPPVTGLVANMVPPPAVANIAPPPVAGVTSPYLAAPLSHSGPSGSSTSALPHVAVPSPLVANSYFQQQPGLLPPTGPHYHIPPGAPLQHLPQQQGAAEQQQQQRGWQYLYNAYRVGMLAMETLARRVQDDRPQYKKFPLNPPYGEEIKWLLGVAKKLGGQYLQKFCLCCVDSVASPFILFELAVDVSLYLNRQHPPQQHTPVPPPTVVPSTSPQLYQPHLRSNQILQPLVQKCLQKFSQCCHVKMCYINASEYEEFVNIVCTARKAFHMAPNGVSQFNELLSTLKRSKSCKKELWHLVTTRLQQTTL